MTTPVIVALIGVVGTLAAKLLEHYLKDRDTAGQSVLPFLLPWVFITLVGYVVGIFSTLVVALSVSERGGNLPIIVGCSIVGLIQWAVLSRYVNRSTLWVFANAGAAYLLLSIPFVSDNIAYVWAALNALGGPAWVSMIRNARPT